MAAVYHGLRRRRALQAPARQIAANVSAEASIVAGKILDNKDAIFGYNAQTGAHGDMIAMDIVDLVKVVRTGLQDATSVASLLVTTEAMIAEAPKKDPPGGHPVEGGGPHECSRPCAFSSVRYWPFQPGCPLSLAVPMRNNNVRRSVADVVAQHGCVLDVRFEVDSLSTIIDMVMEGKAYSILTPSAIQKEASQGQVRTVKIIDPVITRSVVLAVNPKDERSPAVSMVRKLIPKVVRTLIESRHWSATLPDRA